MKTAYSLTVFNFLVLLFLVFRLGIPFVNETASVLSNTDSIGVFLSAQANQFALMQVMLSILGIGIAIAALWGFFEIKRIAEKKAEDTIKSEAPKLFEALLNKVGREEIERMFLETKMTIDQKSSNDVFQEGIRKMQQDPMDGAHD